MTGTQSKRENFTSWAWDNKSGDDEGNEEKVVEDTVNDSVSKIFNAVDLSSLLEDSKGESDIRSDAL